MKSEPQSVIEEGRILRAGLRRELLTEDDLMAQLRGQGIDDVAAVKQARVEANGTLTVIQRERKG